MSRALWVHVLGWLLLPFAAVFNGAVRDFTYGTMMGEVASHSLSVIPLLVIIAAWAAFLAKRHPLPDRSGALVIGLAWLMLTIGFETTLGLAQGIPLARIVAAYDLTRGSVWPIVPLATLFAPVLAQRLVSARAITASEVRS